MRPRETPIGLQLAHTSKLVSRAFSDALAGANGSIPTWLILSRLMSEEWRAQLDLARAIGIEGPTLTHHLDALEESGLVVRTRDPEDRRAVRLELTDAGREKHGELMQAVIAFNRRLRSGLDDAEIHELLELLSKLERNVGADEAPAG
jgi:MarR family transcriptional regulator, transcriptional regulator for hemolysin